MWCNDNIPLLVKSYCLNNTKLNITSLLTAARLKSTTELNQHLFNTVSAKTAHYSISFTVTELLQCFSNGIASTNWWLSESSAHDFCSWFMNTLVRLSTSLYNVYVSVCVLFYSAERWISWLMVMSAQFLSHCPAPCLGLFSLISAMDVCLSAKLHCIRVQKASKHVHTFLTDLLKGSNTSKRVIHNSNVASVPLKYPHEPLPTILGSWNWHT